MRDVSRRDVVRMLNCAAWAPLVLSRAAVAATGAAEPVDQPVAFEWQVPANQVEIVRRNLTYEGQERPQNDGRSVPVLVVFVGLALLAYLAKAVLALQRQIAYGGVVVDTRTDPVRITHDKALDAGVIVIVGKDGTQIIERNEITDPAQLIEALGKAMGK